MLKFHQIYQTAWGKAMEFKAGRAFITFSQRVKFNYTETRMLDSVHHMTLKYSQSHFKRESVKILPSL